jgi:hypothetical protein
MNSNSFANIILTTYFHIYVLSDYYQNITIFPSNIKVSPICHNINIMWALGLWTHGVLAHFYGPIGQMYQNFQRFRDLWLEVMYNQNFDENQGFQMKFLKSLIPMLTCNISNNYACPKNSNLVFCFTSNWYCHSPHASNQIHALITSYNTYNEVESHPWKSLQERLFGSLKDGFATFTSMSTIVSSKKFVILKPPSH